MASTGCIWAVMLLATQTLACHSQANAIGRGAKSVREFLEKNYTDEAIETDDLTIKLVIKALLEVSLGRTWAGWQRCTGCAPLLPGIARVLDA